MYCIHEKKRIVLCYTVLKKVTASAHVQPLKYLQKQVLLHEFLVFCITHTYMCSIHNSQYTTYIHHRSCFVLYCTEEGSYIQPPNFANRLYSHRNCFFFFLTEYTTCICLLLFESGLCFLFPLLRGAQQRLHLTNNLPNS